MARVLLVLFTLVLPVLASRAQDPCESSANSQRLSVPSVATAILRLPNSHRVVGGTVDNKPMLQLLDAELKVIRTYRLDFNGGLTDGHVYSMYYDPAGFVLVHTYHFSGGAIEMGVVKISADLQQLAWSRHFTGTNQNVLFSTLQVDGRGDYLMSGSRHGTFGGSSGCDALLLTLDEATGRTKATLSGHIGSCDDWLQLRQIGKSLYAVGRWDPENQSTGGYRMSLTKFTADRTGVEWVKYYVAPGTATARCYALDLVARSDGLTLVGIGDKDGIDVPGSDAILVSTDLDGKAQRIDYFDSPIANAREAISQVAVMSQGLRLGGAYMKDGFIYNFVAQLDADNQISWATSVALDRYTISQADYAIALGKRFDFFEDRTDIYGTTVEGGVTYAASLTLDARGGSTSSCSVVEPMKFNQTTERAPATYVSRFEVSRTPVELAVRPLELRTLQVSSVPICSSDRTTSRVASYCQGAEVRLSNLDPTKRDVSFRAIDSSAVRTICKDCPDGTLRATRSGIYLFGDLSKPCVPPDTFRVYVSRPDTAYRSFVTCEPTVRLPDGRTVTESGRYTATRPTSGGCDSTIISDIVLGSASNVPFRASLCQGDSLRLFGNTYTTGGDYQRVIETGACAKTIDISLSVHPSYALRDTQEVCSSLGFEKGGKRWLPGEVSEVRFETAYGCDSVQTTAFLTGVGPRTSTEATICEGTVHQFAGESFAVGGTYERRFTRDLQCDSVATLQLSVRPMSRGQTTYAACFGDTLLISDLALIRDSTWRVTALGANGCDSIHTHAVRFRDLPLATLDTLRPACNGETNGLIVLSHPDDLALRWLDGAPGKRRQALPAGTYEATLTDSFGCVAPLVYTVQAQRSIEITADIRAPTCAGSRDAKVQLQPKDSVANSAMGAFAAPDHHYTGLAAGRYAIHYFDIKGCHATDTLTVYEGRAPPRVFHESPLNLVLGDSLRLEPIYDITSTLTWNSPVPLSCYDCATPWVAPVADTEIGLLATDSSGCTSSAVVRLIVAAGPRLFVPTAFTPNGDRINDRWVPMGRANVDRVLRLAVYDRWGEMVHSRSNVALDDPALAWDGTFRDKALDAGVFAYVAEYVLKNGELIVTHGEFTLVR